MNTDYLALAKAFLYKQRLWQTCGSVCEYGLSLITRKPLVHFYPPALMLEPTNICNLHCPLCLTGNGKLLRPRGMMSLPLFKKICREVQNKIGMLILWNQGEPFLNPDFYAMLEYASKQNFYTMTSTNASLELDIERIVKSGLHKIIISLDGITAETYNKYRINGNFDLVLKNMQELVHQKEKLHSNKPYIVWQFLIMKHNENEIEEVKHLARKLKIDKLEFKTAQIYSSDDLAFLPSDHKYSRYFQQGNKFTLKTQLKNRCIRLWTQPVINWDGEMNICCYDKNGSIKIGNIQEHSFSELWCGKKIQKMRKAILNNRSAFEICQNCGEGIVQKIKMVKGEKVKKWKGG